MFVNWRRGQDSPLASELTPKRTILKSIAKLLRKIGAYGSNPVLLLIHFVRLRRGQDSNLRYLAVHIVSNDAHSTTLPPLHVIFYLNNSFVFSQEKQLFNSRLGALYRGVRDTLPIGKSIITFLSQ